MSGLQSSSVHSDVATLNHSFIHSLHTFASPRVRYIQSQVRLYWPSCLILNADVMSQEYVAAKAGSQLNLDSAQGDQVTSPGTSSGSAGRGKRQAASARAEEMHEQQALLNQLKEVPVKGMNASLLVAPLLDHGECL